MFNRARTLRRLLSSSRRSYTQCSSSSRRVVAVGATAAALMGAYAVSSTFPTHAGSVGHEVAAKYSVYDLPIGKKFPRVMPCFIEVAKGSRNKYEWDEHVGFLRLDRVLHSAVFYPHNYGFYPQTLCGDGDPLDVLVLGETLAPGCVVDVRALGYMIMEDEKGLDEKVLAVPVNDPRFEEYRTLRDVPEHLLREIAHFFETYKALEKKKWAKIGGWKGTEDTLMLIEQTHSTYMAQKRKADRLRHKSERGSGAAILSVVSDSPIVVVDSSSNDSNE